MMNSVKTSVAFATGTGIDWTPTAKSMGSGLVRPQALHIHASGSMVSAQTLTVTLDDKDGSTYDLLLYTESIAGGTVDKHWAFPDEIREQGLENGSLIKVTLTNTGTPNVTVYAKITYIAC